MWRILLPFCLVAARLPDAGKVGDAAAKLRPEEVPLYFLMVLCLALLAVIVALVIANGRQAKDNRDMIPALNGVKNALWALRLEIAKDKSAVLEEEQ